MSDLSPRTIRHKADALRNIGTQSADHCAAKAYLLDICADRIESLEKQLSVAMIPGREVIQDPPRVDAGPVPAPPEAGGVTVEALDALVRRMMRPQPIGMEREAAAMLRAISPLVEEAEAKRRIEAAGYEWNHDPFDDPLLPIAVWKSGCSGDAEQCTTWPEAAAWAEAQAAKREPAPTKVMSMSEGEAKSLALNFGARDDTAMGSWWDALRGAARDAWDPDTDTIRLPGVPPCA